MDKRLLLDVQTINNALPKVPHVDVELAWQRLRSRLEQAPPATAVPADVSRHAAVAVSYLDHACGMPAGLSLALQRLRDALATPAPAVVSAEFLHGVLRQSGWLTFSQARECAELIVDALAEQAAAQGVDRG